MTGTTLAPVRRTQGGRVCRFLETWCRATTGWAPGRPLRLLPWQRRLLLELFLCDAADPTKRQYRTALIGLPRKNGKSLLGSGLALYGLLADGEPGAEVYSCAGDKLQARIVFAEAVRMVEADPELSAALRVYRDVIEHPASQSVYRVVSSDAKLRQGSNPHLVVFDEVHVQPDEELWHAMLLGMVARRQPLLVGITTAGYDDASLCYRLYEHGRRVQSGEIDDPTFFFRWWEPQQRDCDWHDPHAWAQANPSLGHGLTQAALEADARVTPEHEFRRYHLNQWVKTATAWLPFGAWQACEAPELEIDPTRPVYVGIDMAYSNDCAAVAIAQRHEDRTVVRCRVWENPHPPTSADHARWRINPLDVEAHLRTLYAQYPVPATEIDGEIRPGPEFAYDPAWFSRSAPVLSGEGLALVEYPQSDARMVPAAQTLYQLVTEGRLAHDGNPALARHVENGVVDQRPRGWRISKTSSRRKIDGLIATAIAAHRAQQTPPEAPVSVYETRGIRVLGTQDTT